MACTEFTGKGIEQSTAVNHSDYYCCIIYTLGLRVELKKVMSSCGECLCNP